MVNFEFSLPFERNAFKEVFWSSIQNRKDRNYSANFLHKSSFSVDYLHDFSEENIWKQLRKIRSSLPSFSTKMSHGGIEFSRRNRAAKSIFSHGESESWLIFCFYFLANFSFAKIVFGNINSSMKIDAPFNTFSNNPNVTKCAFSKPSH